LKEAPVNAATVTEWLRRVQTLRLDGHRATPDQLVERLASYWLPTESIIYIGKASSIGNRVRQYYATPLGDKRPHAGGHWIKTLTILSALTVHYAEVGAGNPEEIERRLQLTFREAVSDAVDATYPQPGLVMPFANLEIKGIGRRDHGISGAVLR
jgi:hypothetical protein